MNKLNVWLCLSILMKIASPMMTQTFRNKVVVNENLYYEVISNGSFPQQVCAMEVTRAVSDDGYEILAVRYTRIGSRMVKDIYHATTDTIAASMGQVLTHKFHVKQSVIVDQRSTKLDWLPYRKICRYVGWKDKYTM